jgi:hypothetical protein
VRNCELWHTLSRTLQLYITDFKQPLLRIGDTCTYPIGVINTLSAHDLELDSVSKAKKDHDAILHVSHSLVATIKIIVRPESGNQVWLSQGLETEKRGLRSGTREVVSASFRSDTICADVPPTIMPRGGAVRVQATERTFAPE